jgi:crotonobetainyl-CoA:carnitine CoA-transferase CaiB-like acyl-CoA transferase
VPFAMILTPEELTNDPHAVAIGLFEESLHPIVGRVRLPRHPARFDSTPATLAGGAPALGEHTDEILTELGLAAQIDDLRTDKVVT